MFNEKSLLNFMKLLLENKIPFAFQCDETMKATFWVPNKEIIYVKCNVWQEKDGFGFLSNYTRPRIIPCDLTLEEAFEKVKEHYNHEVGDVFAR